MNEKKKKRASSPQTRSPTYRLAYLDPDFAMRDEVRPVRLQLELLKPEVIQQEEGIEGTVVIFGGTRIREPEEAREMLTRAEEKLRNDPGSRTLQQKAEVARRIVEKAHYYDEARKLASIISSSCQAPDRCDFVVITGGGSGIMEAANRGAHDVGAKSIGFNIVLPHEQEPNRYITPELCFQFHYFALRKIHFLLRAKALVIFPGGFGTLDELFETLTLRQTNRMQEIPVILCGREYWEKAIDFQFLADEGVVDDRDLRLMQFANTAQEAWEIIATFHDHD